MIQEKHLIFGARELGVILVIFLGMIDIMKKSEIYEVKTILNMIIIVFALTVVYLYCNFQLLILELFRFFKRLKEKSKKSIKELGEKAVKNKEASISNVFPIRCENYKNTKREFIKKTIELTEKQKQAIEYTQKVFGNYIKNSEDLENLCQEIIAYSNGKNNFLNLIPIKVEKITNLDLYHFGWNIWKHFRVGKQDEIVLFLKSIFRENLVDVDIKTIKSHLKDDEKKGTIKIKEDLTKLDDE